MRYPSKPSPGDRVAVVSPGAGIAGIFPGPYGLGLRRLRDDFGLEPVEYPTTRQLDADPRDRARDLQAAFADRSIAAVLATIGGDDMITVTPHLDPAVLRANPKPYFGYSDNTNVLHFLFGQGLVAYHGGSVMVHLGRSGGLHPVTETSLRAALFTSGWYELRPSPDYTDEPVDWQHPAYGEPQQRMFPSDGWRWAGATAVVEAPIWGGNLEALHWLMAADRVGPNADYAGSVLVIETSEELPPALEVYRMLRDMGERGLLGGFPAVLVGRPKCWERNHPLAPGAKQAYADDQRAAVTRALGEYAPGAVVVFDLDIGHTDPQQILPYGGLARVDAAARTIAVRY
ncbi:MAG TPA: S66 peptidase family protein [Asanoa sp.]